MEFFWIDDVLNYEEMNTLQQENDVAIDFIKAVSPRAANTIMLSYHLVLIWKKSHRHIWAPIFHQKKTKFSSRIYAHWQFNVKVSKKIKSKRLRGVGVFSGKSHLDDFRPIFSASASFCSSIFPDEVLHSWRLGMQNML